MASFAKRLHTVLTDLQTANDGNRATLAAQVRTLAADIGVEVVARMQSVADTLADVNHPVAPAVELANKSLFQAYLAMTGRDAVHTGTEFEFTTGLNFAFSDAATYTLTAASDEVGQTTEQIVATVAELIAAQ